MGKEMRFNMNNNHANAMPPADLLSKWGFEVDLFNADEARKETRLDSVMEYPEWFLEVLGNTKSLNFIIITGPRGAGKSSIRRSISDHCSTRVGNDILGGSILCINIDHDSPRWVENFSANSKKPSVSYFCEEIVDQLLVAIITYADIENFKDKLDKKEAFFLERYIYKLQSTRPDDVSVIADRLLSKYKKIRNSAMVQDWLGIITSLFGNQVSLENRTVETSAIEDLPIMIQIVKKCGFDAIYILVDEIDEYDLTTGKPDYAAEMIVPILSSINLLEKESLGLKFFLSAPVYQRLDSVSKNMHMEIRYDRTLQPDAYVLEWSDESIATMLKKRLMSYSVFQINSLQSFCASDLKNIDQLIVKYAYRNPRHMIQFCDRIVRYTAREAYANDFCITKSIFEKALLDFCRWICTNIYPKEYVAALSEYGKNDVDDENFAEANEITIEKSREILDEMTRLGAFKAKTILSGKRNYKVCDPRLNFIIEKHVEID